MNYQWIGALVPLTFAVILGAVGIWSAKSGRMVSRGGIYTKEEFPQMFRMALMLCWLVTAVMLAAGIFTLASL